MLRFASRRVLLSITSHFLCCFSSLQRRLLNAAKKAVARMPLRQIKPGDPVRIHTHFALLLHNISLYIYYSNLSSFLFLFCFVCFATNAVCISNLQATAICTLLCFIRAPCWRLKSTVLVRALVSYQVFLIVSIFKCHPSVFARSYRW